MLRETEDATVPLSLQLAVRDHHKGLVAVELGQMKGQRSYTTIGDGRWKMTNDANEPPGNDEAPSTAPERIARELWQAAVDWRGQHGGDARFQVKLWCVDKKGETAATASTFTVDDNATVNTEEVIEARARASFTTEMTAYTGLVHTRLLASYKELANVAKAVEKLLSIPLTILERAIDLRMDALEDRIEAMVDDDGSTRAKRVTADETKLEGWKQAGEQLKELANGPVGKAMAAKLLGIEGDEAMKMLGLGTPGGGAPDTIRGTLIELGKTLTLVQRERMKTELGTKVDTQGLFDAAMAEDEHAAASKAIDFFAALEAQGLISTPDTILNDEQGKLLARVMTLCEQHVEAAEAEKEKES